MRLAGEVQIGLADFFSASANVVIEKSAGRNADVLTGLSADDLIQDPSLKAGLDKITGVSADYGRIDDLPVEVLAIGATDVEVHIGGNDRDDALFSVEGVDFGLGLFSSTPAADPDQVVPSMYALKASLDDSLSISLAGITLEVGGLSVELNGGGDWIAGQPDSPAPYIDFQSSFADTGGKYQVNENVALDFNSAVIGLELQQATLQVSEFVYLRGDFALRHGSTETVTLNAGLLGDIPDVEVSVLNMGADNVQAFVGTNGPYQDESGQVNEAAVGFAVDDLSFGLTVMTPTGAVPGVPQDASFLALRGAANSVGFVGFDADVFALSLSKIGVALNTGSQNNGIVVDFAASFPANGSPAGYAVQTGGMPVLLDFDSETIQAATDLATITLSDFVSVVGSFAFTKKSADSVTFSGPGLSVVTPAEIMTIGARDVYAFAGIDGPYIYDSNDDGLIDQTDLDNPNTDAIGIHIADLDFGLAIVTPTTGSNLNGQLPGDMKFYGFSGSVAQAGLIGTEDYVTLEGTDLLVKLNSGKLPGTYVDFGALPGGGLDVATGTTTDPITLDFSGANLTVDIGNAKLGLLGLFELETSFGFSLDVSGGGPRLDLSALAGQAQGAVSEDSGMLGEIFGEAMDVLENFQVFIVPDPSGLSVTGHFEVSDVQIQLADFVYLEGNFAVDLGQSVTLDIAHGLPGDITDAVAEQVNDLLESIPEPLRPTIDGSTISGWKTNAITVGGSDINLFVGLSRDENGNSRSPDFDDLAHDDGLIGFGLSDLDIGIGIFKPDAAIDIEGLPTLYSMKTTADQIGIYGFGDFLTLEMSDLELNVNWGGKWFDTIGQPAIDFAGTFPTQGNPGDPDYVPAGFAVSTGADPVYLDFDGQPLLGASLGNVKMMALDFVYLEGSLAFEMGPRYDVDVETVGIPGLPESFNHEVETITLGGYDLDAFVGLGANADGTLADDAIGLSITGFDFGLAIFRPTLLSAVPGLAAYAPKYMALSASVDAATFVGLEDLMSVTVADVEVALNIVKVPGIAYPVPAFLNFATSFETSAGAADGVFGVKTGARDGNGDEITMPLDFDSMLLRASIGWMEVDIAGAVYLSGSMALELGPTTDVTLTNGSPVKVLMG